jgi:hypothetical protein
MSTFVQSATLRASRCAAVLKNTSAAVQRCSGSLKTQALQRYRSVLQSSAKKKLKSRIFS